MGRLLEDITMGELKTMRDQGMTFKEMGDALGVSEATVRKYTPHVKGKHVNVDVEEVKRLRAEGMSLNEIANLIGCSYSGVRYCLTRSENEMGDFFRKRRERIEAKYASEPAQAPETAKQEEVPKACLITFETNMVLGNDKRKYTIHWDDKVCEITMHTEYGDILLKPEDVQGIANECSAVLRWIGDSPTLKMEVV